MVEKEEVLRYVEDLIRLTGFSEKDGETLAKYRDVALKWANDVVKEFYDTLFSYEPTAKVFREGERPLREKTLREWYERLFDGKYDDSFWLWQWYVGIIHIKRKVYNRYMLAMMGRVQLAFLRKALSELPPDEAIELCTAFKRLTDVIAGLIAESYHLTYIYSLEAVAGIKPALAEKMMSLHLNRELEKYAPRS